MWHVHILRWARCERQVAFLQNFLAPSARSCCILNTEPFLLLGNLKKKWLKAHGASLLSTPVLMHGGLIFPLYPTSPGNQFFLLGYIIGKLNSAIFSEIALLKPKCEQVGKGLKGVRSRSYRSYCTIKGTFKEPMTRFSATKVKSFVKLLVNWDKNVRFSCHVYPSWFSIDSLKLWWE